MRSPIMAMTTDYYDDAKSDAREMVDHFLDEV